MVRTPTVLQMENTECGAASLSILLQYYGRYVPLTQLRELCGVSRDGSDAANLILAARSFGLDAKGFQKGIDALEQLKPPAILFWEFNHFVVLEATTPQGIWVNNPATGRLCLTPEEFDRSYTGVVISMQPGAGFQRGGQRRSPAHELLRQLRRVHPSLAVRLLICQGVAVALAVRLATAGNTSVPPALLVGLVLAVAVMPGLIAAVRRTITVRSGARIQRQMLQMPEWALQQHALRELSSRHQGLRRISDVIGDDLLWQLPAVMALLMWSGWQLNAQPLLGTLVLGGTPVLLVLLVLDHNLQRPQDNQTVRKASRARQSLQQSLEDPRTMKSLALERWVLQRWSGLQAEATAERLQQLRPRHVLRADGPNDNPYVHRVSRRKSRQDRCRKGLG